MLNPLTSIMSQLLDKVDLLSVELSRTKKLVSPMEIKPKSQARLYPQRPNMAIKFQHIVDQNLLRDVPVISCCIKKKKKKKA